MACAMADGLGIRETDTVMPVVPMFHVNAWGLPFTAPMVGANLVLPGPYLDAPSLLELLVSGKVTVAAGVPTVWMSVLQALDREPGRYDLGHLRTVICGGSAVPAALMRGLEERHGLRMLHAWGMTEMAPVGTTCHLPSDLLDAPADEQIRYRVKQGTPLPMIEIRARSEEGLVPWDGQTMGELEVRGPWVASAYYNVTGPDDRFTDDGWFRTGDIVTITSRGCIEITDRSKDLVKSGGEWISSVALENALMGHPKIAEAAVIAVPHPKWDERPLAVVALKPDCTITISEVRDYLAPQFAKWWLPDAVRVVPQIPRTAAGKFLKSRLREQFKSAFSA
jgi:fatty-acyl-CoA synthase